MARGGSSSVSDNAVAAAARRGPAVADNGAGLVLAVIVWCWFVAPMLRGGNAELRKMIAAKFFNQQIMFGVFPDAKIATYKWLP